MKILFDQGTPAPLRHELAGHEVSTASEMGWGTLTNGGLLRAASHRFDVLLTTDQNMPHQQNLKNADLAVVILPTTSWRKIRMHTEIVRDALRASRAGEMMQIVFPD